MIDTRYRQIDYSSTGYPTQATEEATKIWFYNDGAANTTAQQNTILNWSSNNRTIKCKVYVFNQSRQIIYDTVNDGALISANTSDQKTAIFGSHSSNADVTIVLDHCNRHTTDDDGNTITDYAPYMFIVYYGVRYAVMPYVFYDYALLPVYYVSGFTKDNTENILTISGFDLMEKAGREKTWGKFTEWLPSSTTTITAASLLNYLIDGYQTGSVPTSIVLENLGADATTELYYQSMLLGKVNLSSSSSQTLRECLDSLGEAFGLEFNVRTKFIPVVTTDSETGEVTSVDYSVKDNSIQQEIVVSRHKFDSTNLYPIYKDAVYNFVNCQETTKYERIGSVSIKNDFGNDYVYSFDVYPDLGTTATLSNTQFVTYYVRNNPFLSLVPLTRLTGETTSNVPFTLEDYTQKLLQNSTLSNPSLSNALYFSLTVGFVGSPLLMPGDTVNIYYQDTSGTINYYYTVYEGADFTYDGGLRTSIDTEFLNDTFKEVEDVQTVISAVSRVQTQVDQLNTTIQLLAEKVPDNLEGRLEQAEIKITPEEISEMVSDQYQGVIENLNDEIVTLKHNTEWTQSATQISAKVNTYVNSVKTSNGMTFDSNGLTLDRDGAATHTVINESSLTVKDDDENNLLYVGTDGVTAKDLSIDGYAIIGDFKLMKANSGKVGFYYLL